MDYGLWFSERLTQLRMEKNVSARDMSLSLGQSESYINKIENHRTLPSLTVFFSICEYFEISPEDFFCLNQASPEKTKEITKQIQKLPPEKAAHILTIIGDILSEE